MSYFGDPTIVVKAFINQLENWKSTNDYNKQKFVAFALFLKRLVQAFQYLGYTADQQSSTLMKKAKKKSRKTSSSNGQSTPLHQSKHQLLYLNFKNG